MGYPNKILPYYTYEDYLRWEGQWEVIEGIPYAMSPMPRPEHQKIAGNLHAEFRAALKSSDCDCTVYQPIDYKVTEDTILNPDLLIVCNPITKQYLDFPPEVVIEILSPATALKDRHTKYEIYQQQGIPYYLIVDIDLKNVEVFQFDKSAKYKAVPLHQDENFSFELPECSFSLLFKNIWS
jgi:Uma2 family endonuclease